ncbi:MAG: signal peptide peptidase SppA [Spirochaetaceae bacterium]|nr:signal peptide peptidase SppA [Spirochaetaceae bacterium]
MNTRSAVIKNKSIFSLLRGDYIGVLKIEGTIEPENSEYNQRWLLETIERLTNDPQNRVLVIEINTPGGSVYESDEAYLALRSYAQQKPLYAYCTSLAASGGYYIACAADTIFANRNTLTGSIGVISGQSIDITGLLEKAGVKITTITAGSNKNMLNFNERLSEEQKAIMQSIADECYTQFTTIVAERRNIDLATVQSIADGRIYTAQQALDLKLIDGINDFGNTISVIIADNDLSGSISLEYFEYEKQQTFLENFLGISSLIDTARSETSAVFKYLDSQVAFPAYYFKF